MQHVRHQLLEAHVLDPGHAFGAFEVGLGPVAARLALAGVVDEELGDLAEGAALLAVVDDEPASALLGGPDAHLDAVREIGPAGADVGAEDVGAVAFVVHAAGDLAPGIGDRARVAEDVHGDAADRGQEDLQVVAGHELGEHAPGVLEQAAAQLALRDAEALGDARQVPHRLDRRLRHPGVAVPGQDLAVGPQPARRDRLAELGHVHPRPGHRDGGADVPAGGELVGERFAHQVPVRIEGDDGRRAAPLPMRADAGGRGGVGEVRDVEGIEGPRRHREGAVERIGAGVRPDGVALRGEGADDGAALRRVRCTPADRHGRAAARRMRVELDVPGGRRTRGRGGPGCVTKHSDHLSGEDSTSAG